ncbi:MAG: hypothetical protein JSV99_11665 [Planctomycetota bacterium]|nr:MAG: hypothetical protein JSV99_11665 [Planctomycetota bacterium]
MDRKRSRRMGGVTVLFAVVVVCVFGKTGFGQAEGAGDELLRAMPAETLFAVRVNKFDWTVGQLDQFLMGASPVPVGVSMIARMQIAGVLGDAELKNVDTNGSFAIFGLAAGEPGGGVEGVFIAGLLPVSNFEAFLKENASCSEPDENGISRITTADMTGGSRTMLTAKVGSFAMVTSGELYDGLVKVVKAVSAPGYAGLTGKLDEGQIEESVNEPVWAYVDMQEVQRRFGDVIKEELSEIQGMMAMAQSGGGQPMPAGLMEALGGLMEGFMSQTESISVTADPKPTVLNLRERIKAVDGTTMWDLCSAGPPLGERTELFGYLPDKTTMSMGCTIDKAGWKALNRCGIEFCRVMAGESLGSDDAEKMRQLADDLVDSFGERLVCSFVSEPPENPLVYTYVIEVTDAEKLNAVIDAGPEVWNKIAGVFKDMGLEMSYSVERGSDSYKGVTIDSAFMSMTSTEPNTQQGQMMDAMYGGGFDYRWAIVNGLYVCVIGGDVDAGVRRLIDQVQASGAKEIPAELEQAMGLLPDAGAAEAVGTYNLLRAMTIGFAMSPMPMPMPDIESKSNISFAAKGGDGTLSIDIAVPKEHLSEVVSAGMMMQQAMMQGQKQAAAAPKARAAAKPMPRVKIPSAGPVTEIGPNKGKLVIEPGVDIGGVRFGMTAEKMEEILGPAESRTGCAYYYFDSGFAVITASDGTVDVVLCGCLGNADSPLVKNCGYRTSGDVGMGCRRAKVIATYGEPTSVRKHGDGTGATTLEYDQMFCRFTVIDDKVVQMVFRRPR